jgi:hypothetical protein
VRALLEKSGISPSEVAGVGIDGQSWSAIAVDREGNVLTRNPIWMDVRAEAICRETERRVGADAIFALSGNALKAVLYAAGKGPLVHGESSRRSSQGRGLYPAVQQLPRLPADRRGHAGSVAGLRAGAASTMRRLCWDGALCTKALGYSGPVASCSETVALATTIVGRRDEARPPG